MECKFNKKVNTNNTTPVPRSNMSPMVEEAIKHGKSRILQEYGGKLLVRYEYEYGDGRSLVVLAETLLWLTGKTDKVDFSRYKVVTVYDGIL